MDRLQIYINNQLIDKPLDSDIGLRLQRFLEDDYNLTQRGGDYSLTLNLPWTKANERLFGNKSSFFQYRKFAETVNFPARIELNGSILFEGIYRLRSVTRQGYQGEFAGENLSWLKDLETLRLRDVGMVNGQPGWLIPFFGMNTANSYNQSFDQDIVFPDISYNNVPVTDYLDYTYDDIFGTDPKDLPYDMPTRTAHWSWRFGSTFEDFPPAVKYEAIIRKIFETAGYDVKGEILTQDWFKRLILPYVGDGYVWNWMTLARLELDLISRVVPRQPSVPFSVPSIDLPGLSGLYSGVTQNYYEARNCLQDSPIARIDRVANFKKFGVTDRSFGYVAPVDGIYTITATTEVFSELQYASTSAADALIDNCSQGVANTGWDDNVLLIVRENEAGEFVLDPDLMVSLADFLTNRNTNFIDNPSDVIAYVIPSRAQFINTYPSRRWVVGSPIQEFQVEPTWTLTSHNTLYVPLAGQRSSSSSVTDFSVTVQLRKNERVHAYWVSLNQIFTTGSTNISKVTTTTNVSSNQTFTISYDCGTEDIDVARNLPDITAKEFISSFIRLFNLTYVINPAVKSVTFLYNRFRDSNPYHFIDITEAIDADSIEMRPVTQPQELRLGYENDDNDRLLTSISTNCTDETRDVTEYGNVILTNDSVYADGSNEIRLMFSATRFVEGVFDTIDYAASGINIVSTFNDPNGIPFNQGLDFTPDTRSALSWLVPSIQSQDSFDQSKLGGLTYDWNYKPRLLYFVGVPDPSRRFLVGAPFDTVQQPNFWKMPTQCSFDGEHLQRYPNLFLPSIRFDRFLYDSFFTNQKEVWNNSFILEANIYLNSRLWQALDGSQRVVFNEDVFRLMSVEDYDVSGNNPAKIKLLKLI